MRRPLRILTGLVLIAALAWGALLLYGYARDHPQDLPWTPLDLTQPVGSFTGRKLTGLTRDSPHCRALLRQAGVRFTPLPGREAGPNCGYEEAVRLDAGGAARISWRPAGVGTSCAVAAALVLWEWHVVQPAALKHFGRRVAAIDHFGSYSCRRLYGRDEGAWSEHATANAIDVAGFRLEGGTRISVLDDWRSEGARGAFLREVRDGACRLFATVLSPEYNAAHRDHFHFDQADRGQYGWRGCR